MASLLVPFMLETGPPNVGELVSFIDECTILIMQFKCVLQEHVFKFPYPSILFLRALHMQVLRLPETERDPAWASWRAIISTNLGQNLILLGREPSVAQVQDQVGLKYKREGGPNVDLDIYMVPPRIYGGENRFHQYRDEWSARPSPERSPSPLITRRRIRRAVIPRTPSPVARSPSPPPVVSTKALGKRRTVPKDLASTRPSSEEEPDEASSHKPRASSSSKRETGSQGKGPRRAASALPEPLPHLLTALAPRREKISYPCTVCATHREPNCTFQGWGTRCLECTINKKSECSYAMDPASRLRLRETLLPFSRSTYSYIADGYYQLHTAELLASVAADAANQALEVRQHWFMRVITDIGDLYRDEGVEGLQGLLLTAPATADALRWYCEHQTLDLNLTHMLFPNEEELGDVDAPGAAGPPEEEVPDADAPEVEMPDADALAS
ncbi:hypothetical protein BDZ94DRAFT_1234894 [Collybia nuda]|uniref:Uncharacterized protein n=1 Tax=Collybia nuda TaxID=64659 RepID=A0A9P6CGC7_9AGAR|nr:hypothetical protein BDZ94DRAFT_1234894 [Collybia nuda]